GCCCGLLRCVAPRPMRTQVLFFFLSRLAGASAQLPSFFQTARVGLAGASIHGSRPGACARLCQPGGLLRRALEERYLASRASVEQCSSAAAAGAGARWWRLDPLAA